MLMPGVHLCILWVVIRSPLRGNCLWIWRDFPQAHQSLLKAIDLAEALLQTF
jgi:hypothetical protein